MTSLRLTGLFAVVLLGAAMPARGAERPADLVVLGGKVLTVDARFSTASAVAIRDGVFVLVGSDAEARIAGG